MGAVLALGISDSEPASQATGTQNSIAVPKEKVAPAIKPKSISPSTIRIPKTAPKTPIAVSKSISSCHSGYSGCLKRNAGDYDCSGGSGNGPNYTGKVKVYGSDPFGLDRDKDGWGCE